MNVTQNERFTAAFVVTWADLEDLAGNVCRHLPQVRFEAKCADKLARNFSTLEELKEFPNPEGKAIQKLTLFARSDDHESRLVLSLSNDVERNVDVSLGASEESAVALSGYVSEQLRAMRPWYSSIARITAQSIFLPMMYLGAAAGVVCLIVVLVTGEMSHIHWGNMAPGLFFGWGIGIVLVAIAALLEAIRKRIFPIGVFAIGHGLQRHKNLEIIRTAIELASWYP
jgi:hypothetical protein